MLKRTVGICLASAAFFAGAQARAQVLPPPPSTATMFCDYETSTSCSPPGTNLQCASSSRAALVRTPRTNSYAIALTTQSGDTGISGSGSWERCDLSFRTTSGEGTDEWWWSSIYFPDSFVIPTSGQPCSIIGPEFHSDYSGDTQPNFEWFVCAPGTNGGLQARVYGGAGSPQTDGPGRRNFAIRDPYGSTTITKNKWYDVLMHTKWSYTSAGITQVWINGVQVINYNGPNLYQGWRVYLKLPNYHAPYGRSSTVYYDRTVRGPTQASVVPSTSTTTPTPETPTDTTGGSGTTTKSYVAGYAGTPYSGTPITLPGTFEAENFDGGRQGIAYYDTTAGNLGGQYRQSEDVDIISSCDSAGGGYVVNNFASGEGMNYTVNVATSGNYVFQLRASNKYTRAQPAVHIEIDGVRVTGSVSVPPTNAWCTFRWVPTPAVNLSAGYHVVRIVSDQQYFNLNSVRVTAVSSTTTSTYMSTYKGKPYTGTPIAIPGSFMAANFDQGGQDVAFYDTTSTNIGGQYRPNEAVDVIASCDASRTSPYVINNFATGEWQNYTINVPTAGNYIARLRVSNNYSPNVAFHLEVDGVRTTGPLLVPMTGGWCAFQWVSTPAIALSAGTHVLKIMSDQQYFNLETVNVVTSP